MFRDLRPLTFDLWVAGEARLKSLIRACVRGCPVPVVGCVYAVGEQRFQLFPLLGSHEASVGDGAVPANMIGLFRAGNGHIEFVERQAPFQRRLMQRCRACIRQEREIVARGVGTALGQVAAALRIHGDGSHATALGERQDGLRKERMQGVDMNLDGVEGVAFDAETGLPLICMAPNPISLTRNPVRPSVAYRMLSHLPFFALP